ncbi:type VII secretion-associated serine protease mycosin [uncultured Williamsia sp.]|uniref:type VII secretion-associated serine protease mycosin n=1 Tax=uncultured Williamsia sp. TaxID=259311 RepID=UPI002628EDD2|nr:type VII secretion-associated serine protease mycosin [uncultured Williamsia sp.]
MSGAVARRGRTALLRVGLAAAVGVAATSALPLTDSAMVGVARAMTPPTIAGPVPSDSPIAPSAPTRQTSLCSEMVSTKADHIAPPTSLQMLDIDQAWKFSRGAGQRVAVIDTGVFRHPRLSVIPGGDYVSSGNGTTDCDGHGTQVAGIIAAKQSPDDGFAGVAPDATIIAIRQSSANYGPADSKQASSSAPVLPEGASEGAGDVTTLARAVVRAVNLGATVINISVSACGPAGSDLGDRALGAAVKFAYDRNVVVVAAADNTSPGNGGACAQNAAAAQGGRDPDPWSMVSTKSSPAYFTPYVVSVGAVEDDGTPATFSLAGPWVTVAAPGRDMESLNTSPNPAVIDATRYPDKPIPITGTSFAAPLVSGLAALIRSKFPQLTARQVIDRITRTAHHPADGRDGAVGYGLIDPVAALTTTTPDALPSGADSADPRTGDSRNVFAAEPLRPAPATPAPSAVPRYVAIGVAAGAGLLAVLSWMLVRRRTGDRRRLREGIDY